MVHGRGGGGWCWLYVLVRISCGRTYIDMRHFQVIHNSRPRVHIDNLGHVEATGDIEG